MLLGFAAGVDIRQHGSKNIGATNVFRVAGKWWGIAALALDFFKGWLAVWLASSVFSVPLARPYPAIIAALAVVLGHMFPVWLKFRGGKGVASSAGAMLGLMWQPFLIALAAFVITVAISRYISLGSMVGAVVLVIALALIAPAPLGADLPLLVLALCLAAMIIYRHRQNISRILAGTENRFPPPKQQGERIE